MAHTRARLGDLLRVVASRAHGGHPRTPATFIMTGGGCEYYWSGCRDLVPDLATWERLAALSRRYRRYHRYLTEVLPAWREIRRVEYADNSVVAFERARDGRERARTLVCPGGDACY